MSSWAKTSPSLIAGGILSAEVPQTIQLPQLDSGDKRYIVCLMMRLAMCERIDFFETAGLQRYLRCGPSTVLVLLLVMTGITHGATLSVPGQYPTIQACANAANPGDICRINAGVYNEAVTVRRDGQKGNPITFIADGNVVITRTLTLEFADYIRIVGFTFDGNYSVGQPVLLHGTVGVELWGNTFREFTDTAVASYWSAGESPHSTVDQTIVIGNNFFGTQGRDYNHFSVWGNDNVFAYNEMNQAGVDFINFYGNRNRFINNYGYGGAENTSLHVDFLQTAANCCGRVGGTDFTLLEANYYRGSAGSDVHIWNLETAVDYSGYFLSRRNVMFHVGSGAGAYDYHHFYVVNDTYSDTQVSSGNGITFHASRPGGNHRVFNNIFTEGWGSSVTSPEIFSLQTPANHEYNLAWDWQSGASPNWAGLFRNEATRQLANPLYVDYAGGDFHLQSNSPAGNSGGPVTTVTVGGTNVLTITVADSGFFRGFNTNVSQYGGNLAIGDLMTVNSQSAGVQTRRISSIAGNVISLMNPITAESGNPVFLGDDSTPAKGAYPDGKATFFISNSLWYTNGVLTATVNDPSIVRHVEFYVDGLPVAVDIEPPYTFSTSGYAAGSTHDVKAIARPLYADRVLAYESAMNITVSLTNSTPRPEPPSNLRVVQ